MKPELWRPFPLDRLGGVARVLVETSEAERAAVAARLGVPELRAFTCAFDLCPAEAGAVLARGRLQARVVQVCVVSLEPFESGIDEAFVLRFVPANRISDALDLDAVEEVPYAEGTLDLGEAAAEQLALALDPFPHLPGAALPVPEPGAESGNPFEALSRLRPEARPEAGTPPRADPGVDKDCE